MARKRELELEVLRLQLQLDQAVMNLESTREERGQYIEKANNLEWQFRAATDQAKDLQEQCHRLATDKAVLMERLDLVSQGLVAGTQQPAPASLPYPTKHEPEEVEDARYAFDRGDVTHAEFRAILDQYGFSNSEIEVDTPGTAQF